MLKYKAKRAHRYERLSTRRVDLVGDYAGNELFLLEGDSLLLNCMSDPLLDFGGTYCVLFIGPATGPQTLMKVVRQMDFNYCMLFS